MRSGSLSQDDESGAKTSGRRAKRKDRRSSAAQFTDEKQISEKQKSPKGSKINGNLTSGSATLLSEAPNRSAGPSENATKIEKPRSTTFGGDDFIPFELYDSPDEEDGVATYGKDRKGKRKATEDDGHSSDREANWRDGEKNHGKRRDGGDVPPWREGPSSEREWDKDKRPHDWGDDRRRPGSRRDMDRDRDGNHKRKYDEYQGDDRDRRRRKLDTASKKCPWMIGVDLEKCRNVAEM